ncbi:MAG: hypothetical protein KGL74_04630 [Elusimicrobia bacterium]|nr:hypothetical protein [Elusimicrobiota bacterium]MDE2510386.1 hypothetical protein [Elusimicrobiota bacterium]
MAPKVKAALSWISEATSIALTFAVAATVAYGLLFVDFTGNGRLWDALLGVAQNAVPAATSSNVTAQMRRVPVRPPDMEQEAQNHMLVMPEVPAQEIQVAVAAPAPVAASDALTDAPADRTAGKDWRVHLQGQLRTFSVYGQGEQSSSAVASVGSAPAASGGGASAPTPAAAGSAYRTGIGAGARPGIGSHVANVSGGTEDGVRNFR